MEYISGYAKGLVAVVIFSSFIELLLPKGDIKKYVSFASGLIIILMAITPLLDIKSIELPKIEYAKQGTYKTADISKTYEQRLENKARQALGISDVKITVNPKNPSEILYASSKQKKQELAQFLGIPMSRVGD